MREAAVVLVALPQSDGAIKNRPALILRQLPGHGDWLICGISTQLHQYVADFDGILDEQQSDFQTSGLLQASLIRLGFLYATPATKLLERSGAFPANAHQRLLNRLAAYLTRGRPTVRSSS